MRSIASIQLDFSHIFSEARRAHLQQWSMLVRWTLFLVIARIISWRWTERHRSREDTAQRIGPPFVAHFNNVFPSIQLLSADRNLIAESKWTTFQLSSEWQFNHVNCDCSLCILHDSDYRNKNKWPKYQLTHFDVEMKPNQTKKATEKENKNGMKRNQMSASHSATSERAQQRTQLATWSIDPVN